MIDKNEQRRRALELEQQLKAQGKSAPTLTIPTQPSKSVPRDMEGKQFAVNAIVLYPTKSGDRPVIQKRVVTKIEDGKVYLDNSHVALKIPSRCYIL
jgi:hypothetical protein